MSSKPLLLRRIIIIATIVIAGMIATELASRYVLRKLLAFLPEAHRNPFRYRCWPDYIGDPIATTNDLATLVIITNCQGYGGEYPEGYIYAAQLQPLLNEKNVGGYKNWKVYNWALDGGTSIEYMLLAAYLCSHPPTAVIAITTTADYRSGHYLEGLSYCRSDLPRLATRPEVFKHLPFSYIKRHFRSEDWLTYAMWDNCQIMRCRDLLWSALDRKFPGIFNLFYAPRVNYLPWMLPRCAKIYPMPFRTPAEGKIHIAYDFQSRAMLKEFIELLAKIPSQVVIAAEPVRLKAFESPQRRLIADIEELIPNTNLTFWDLHDALDDDHFFTSNHLHEKNHYQFAEVLATRLDGLLTAKPTKNLCDNQ